VECSIVDLCECLTPMSNKHLNEQLNSLQKHLDILCQGVKFNSDDIICHLTFSLKKGRIGNT